MPASMQKETVVAIGAFCLRKGVREIIRAERVATSLVMTVFDPASKIAAMAHFALPDSKMAYQPGDPPLKFVDLGIPAFLDELAKKGCNPMGMTVKLVGGAQLFNFGGGSGNVLNIGTRNAITARTLLTREGITVEKAETGGNKPRTIFLDVETGQVQVAFPGEPPRTI